MTLLQAGASVGLCHPLEGGLQSAPSVHILGPGLKYKSYTEALTIMVGIQEGKLDHTNMVCTSVCITSADDFAGHSKSHSQASLDGVGQYSLPFGGG